MKLQLFSLLFFSLISLQAQVYSYKTKQNGKTITHRITMDDTYVVETQYVVKPAEFILTRGGFYTKTANVISVVFEFNSNFVKDGLKQMELELSKDWILLSKKPEDLNGKWLMAGRMTEQGERRRDTSGPRKTMKFLLDGFFQWIAYNTETFHLDRKSVV